MEKIRAFCRALTKHFRRNTDEPTVAAPVVPRPNPPPNGPMTEAQIARMRTLDGFPTEEIVLNLARLYEFSIDEALELIEQSQTGDRNRPRM